MTVRASTGKTIVENLLSRQSGEDVRAGDVVVVPVSKVMTGEGRTPDAMELWESLGKRRGMDPADVGIFIDHMASVPTVLAATLHARLRAWSAENNWQLFDAGSGISHGVFPERGWIVPGEVVACADGHSCTFGALNAFAISVSSSEIAIALQTGKLWFEVPQSIRVTLEGRLQPWVSAKDVILFLVGRYGAEGASGTCVEFHGPVAKAFDIDARLTLANMVVELGGACGLMEADAVVQQFVRKRTDRPFMPATAELDACYAAQWSHDISALEPQVSRPGRHDDVVPLSAVAGTRVSMVFIGSCTNGRYEDLVAAAQVLKGRQVQTGTRLFVTPTSREAMLRAEADGTLQTILQAGALLTPPGCGACADLNGIANAGDDDVVVSTASRNYPGRMGSPSARIFLASPATAAAAAVSGQLTDARNL